MKFATFEIILHLIIAFTFLIAFVKSFLPEKIYNFFTDNKDIIFGIYYLYLAYTIYQRNCVSACALRE